MVGRIDAEEYLKRASALLGQDLKRFRGTGRLLRRRKGRQRYPGVSPVGKGGAFTNKEIWGYWA
jgi:hypothetical protein